MGIERSNRTEYQKKEETDVKKGIKRKDKKEKGAGQDKEKGGGGF